MEDGTYATVIRLPVDGTFPGKVGRDLPVGEHSLPFLEHGVPAEEDVPDADVAVHDWDLHCFLMGYVRVVCQRVLLKEGRGRKTHQ